MDLTRYTKSFVTRHKKSVWSWRRKSVGERAHHVTAATTTLKSPDNQVGRPWKDLSRNCRKTASKTPAKCILTRVKKREARKEVEVKQRWGTVQKEARKRGLNYVDTSNYNDFPLIQHKYEAILIDTKILPVLAIWQPLVLSWRC